MSRRFRMKIRAGETFLYRSEGTESQVFEIRMKSDVNHSCIQRAARLALGLGHDDLVDLFVNKARLALNDGETFNPGGQGFMRLNVAVPRSVLRDAMQRLHAAFLL